MKLPFDLGIKLLYRLLLPGFFLMLGLLPVLFALLDMVGLVGLVGLAARREVAFVLGVIVCGTVIILADMRIYMFLEGRRYRCRTCAPRRHPEPRRAR